MLFSDLGSALTVALTFTYGSNPDANADLASKPLSRSREVFMLDAAALTLGAPASALPDAALAAAGLPSAHQVLEICVYLPVWC